MSSGRSPQVVDNRTAAVRCRATTCRSAEFLHQTRSEVRASALAAFEECCELGVGPHAIKSGVVLQIDWLDFTLLERLA